MMSVVRKTVSMVLPGRRLRWALVSILAMVVGVVEGGAAGAVYLLVRVVQEPQAVFELPVVRYLGALFVGASDSAIVLRCASLVAAYHVTKTVLVLMQQFLQHRVLAEAHAALSQTLLRGYLLLPYPFHFRRHSSELIRNATGAVDVVVNTLSAFDALVRESLIGIGIMTVLFLTAPRATLVSGVILALLVTGLLRLTRQMAQKSGRGQHEVAQSLHRSVQTALGGVKEIKALGRENYFVQTVVADHRRQLQLGQLGVTLNAVPPLIIETAFVLAALGAAALIAVQPGAQADVIPLLGLFAYAAFRMIPMSNRVVLRFNDLQAGRTAVEELYADVQLIRQVVDPDRAPHGESPAFTAELRVERVSYTYPGAERPALSNVTLALQVGGSLGIVGTTGAGKSTLVDLVVGLLVPSAGRILVDGVELTDRHRGWRERVGYVPQTIFLLDESLRRNIALGIADDDIDDVAIQHAIRMAQLDVLVASWPAGVETLLGERGIRLSGGERQRVGIARALYHDPELLVFDEATSALDNVTEAAVSRAIEGLRGRKSLLVIAHRLSTVRSCDRLILLEAGRVVAEGSYDELLASSPAFRRMAEAPDDATTRA